MYKPKFPKPTRKKKSKPRATFKESDLQLQVNSLLRWSNIKFIRIPDLVGRLCSPYSPLKPWEKQILSDAFKGTPDNILMVPINDQYFLGLNLELKTEAGKLSAGQRKWGKEVPVTVVRTLEEAQVAIKHLLEACSHFKC